MLIMGVVFENRKGGSLHCCSKRYHLLRQAQLAGVGLLSKCKGESFMSGFGYLVFSDLSRFFMGYEGWVG